MKKETYPLYFAGVKRPYASAVVAGGFVFCSGASGKTLETGHVPSHDFVEQNRVAWDRVKRALEQAGSSLENIVKFVTYIKKTDEVDYFETCEKARLEYFKENCPAFIENPPAYTLVQVPSLAQDDMLVEIDVIAVRPDILVTL